MEAALAPGVRVVVAMSGGVDSSTVAALLVERGCDVVGVTLQLYDHGQATGRKGACCAGQDIRDAACVAGALGIPHYVLDYEKRFRAEVIDDFADAYVAGETPVPCVRCNETVKFRDLLAVARDLGAGALATGHYARRIDGPEGPELHRAADASRDQSYFLYRTTREQLAFLRFPLGELSKDETRALADRFALPVAQKPDSQDICFVPSGRYDELIERLRPGAAEPGDVVDESGHVLGQHDGVIHFTVGQRKGLGVAGGEPLYVLRLDPDRRRVIVGPRDRLGTTRVPLRRISWLGPHPGRSGVRVAVKLRSAQLPLDATLSLDGERGAAVLDEPAFGVAPGQACVAYDGDRVLGGGWIARA
ncbi:MAG: tRNA 2-thiouridine(34) synthase MnmA [Alphaproteobacteria bacterium]|nr:tRNA 2-thiouridine(34) synthase MnmA [Alphaproteobacteria bacterium]